MTIQWKQLGKRLLKGLGWFIGGALALVVTFYVVVLLINLRDQPPSEFALRLENIHQSRPAVADADNGYIYVMEFPAAPANSPAVQPIFKACAWESNECDTALAANDATLPEWFAAEQWRVDHYRTLLARPRWLETVPSDLSAPLPAYSPVLEAQKLLLAQAYYLAGQKDANGVREILEQDVRFWRRVLAESDILISRMIAVAALARHFNMGNLALRRLPPETQLAALPEAWRTPLTEQELSWHRCFAGEWIYGRNALRQIVAERAIPVAAGVEHDEGFLYRLQDLAISPLFQPQDTSNQSAEMFVRVADALQVPIERFIDGRKAAAEVLEAQTGRIGTLKNLYNPMGNLLSGMGSTIYDVYPPRVADIEGARRAAVLATELRSRKVDVANVRAEIDASNLHVPYTGAPFVWDSKTRSILFIGLAPKERGQHSFKY